MKLTFKKLALLGLSIVAMFVLVGCTDTTTTTTSGSETTSGLTDTQKVQAVLDGISLGDISAVSANLTLPTASVNGVTLTWTSEDVDVINTMGEVTIPTFTEGNATITLTLTATLNSVSLTKEFEVTVSAETADQFLARVGNSIIITGSDSLIASFTLPSTLQGVTITWTSSNPTYASIAEQVDNAGLYKVTINRPIIEDGGVNTSVTLTATMVLGDNQKVITKEVRVLAMNEVIYMTVAEAASEADGTAVMFKGVVTAVLGGSAFVQDTTGGIYLYNVGSSNLAKLVVGNELEVVGEIDIFGGFIEVTKFSKLEVLSTGNALPDALDFDLVDVEVLTGLQGNIVNMTQLKLKSAVTLPSIGTSVYFTLTDGTNDVQIKIDKYIDDAVETEIHALIAALTLNDTFKLVGIPVAIYESAAQFYLTNPSQLVVLNDGEKLAADKTMLTIPLTTFSDGEITLPLSGIGGSVVTWAVNPTTVTINATTGVATFPTLTVDTDFTFTATITKGSLTAETKEFVVTAKAMTAEEKVAADKADLTVLLTAKEYDEVTLPLLGSKGSVISWSVVGDAVWASPKLSYNFNDGVEYNVTLTATITSGDASDTKEFVVVVSPIVFTNVEDMFGTTVAIGDLVVLKGRLTGATTNSAYWIQDATGGLNIYVPSAMRAAFAEIPVGSEVILFGKKQIFNGLYEIEALTRYIVLPTTPELPAFTSIDGVAFNNTDLLAYQGQLVSFAGFTVKTLPATVDANGTYQFTLQDVATGREIVVRLDYRVPNYIATKDQILTFVLDQKVDVQGAILNWYNNYQLSIFSASHVVAHVSSPAEVAADDVAALTIETTVDAGEEVTLPSTSNTSTIVWSVALAEVNASIVSNVVTFANVAETTVVTLTATLTYGTGETAIVSTKTFDVTIIVLTPAQKLAADKDALTVSGTAVEFATITLPTTTIYGSVVTWALTATPNATLLENVLTLNQVGTEYNVVVTATLTLAGEPALVDTKEFTIVVSPVTVITEFLPLITQTEGAWTTPNATGLYVKGIVTGFNGTNGFFIQDASGDPLYVYGSSLVSLVAIGDEVVVYGNLVDYKTSYAIEYRFREIDTASIKAKLSTGNAVVVTTLTVAEIETMNFYENIGRVMEVTGFVVSYDSSNIYFNWKLVGETQYTISLYNSLAPWLRDVYESGDVLPAVQFTLTNISSSFTKVYGGNLVIEMTEQNKVDYDKSLLTTPVELLDDYVLPTAKYESTYAITAISTELAGNITNLGVVTLPETDLVGTITVTVTNGLATSDVVIAVTIKAMTDAYKLSLAVEDMPATLNLAQDFILEPLLFSATYGDVVISTELAANLSIVSGELIVVRPAAGNAAVVGTVTINVALGTETAQKVVNVSVLPFAADLFISEYIEGSSNNKAVEIFNGTGADVDLSTYVIEVYSNGKLTTDAPNYTLTLSGTLVNGDVYVIYNASAIAAITSVGDISSNITFYNGDDIVVLKHSGTIIDSIGQGTGIDPGTNWSVNGVATSEMTLVRISTILSGDTDTTDVYDPSAEWVAYPQDTTTYLGSHVVGDVSSVQE